MPKIKFSYYYTFPGNPRAVFECLDDVAKANGIAEFDFVNLRDFGLVHIKS